MSIFCYSCGQKIKEGDTFCASCGKIVTTTPKSSSVPVSSSASVPFTPGVSSQIPPERSAAMIASLMKNADECLIKDDPLTAGRHLLRVLELEPNHARAKELIAEISILDRKHPNSSSNANMAFYMFVIAMFTGTLTVCFIPFFTSKAKQANEDPGKIRNGIIMFWAVIGIVIGGIIAWIVLNSQKNSANESVNIGKRFMDNNNFQQADLHFKNALSNVKNHSGAHVYLKQMEYMSM
ncbi:MAG: hypothetical protein ACTSO7_13985 [Candidatus Heimdallarchaeota archaeon]